MSQPEWNKTPWGSLHSEQQLPNGITRSIRVRPRGAIRMIHDMSSDASRFLFQYGPVDPESLDFSLQFISKRTNHPQVIFLDRDNRSLMEVAFPGEYQVQVKLRTLKADEELEVAKVEDKEALVTAIYEQSGIARCTLQAEALSSRNDSDIEIVNKTWRELLPIFINFQRSTDRAFLSSHGIGGESVYDNHIFDHYPSAEHPVVQEANTAADELINYVLSTIPPDDQQEVKELLTLSKWKYTIVLDLLRCVESKRAATTIVEILEQKDAFLEDLLREDVDSILAEAAARRPIAQMLLELTNISHNGFYWQEVKVEEDEDNGEDKLTVVQEGKSRFNTEVPIQDNTFRIVDNGNNLLLICATTSGSRRWEARIPFALSISLEDATRLGADPEADFRELKLGISATIEN